MDPRDDKDDTELCALCGEEVDLQDTSAHARVEGRVLCRTCSQKLGGRYNPDDETWTQAPRLPDALRPRED